MQRFGSASNFFGGVGESNHKTFVNDTGNNTQQRANNFTSQIALRYYERMVCDIADKVLVQRIQSQYYETQPYMTHSSSYIVMEGKYKLTLDIKENGFTDPIVSNQKTVPVKFVEAVVKHITP